MAFTSASPSLASSPQLSPVCKQIVQETNTALSLVERGGCRIFFPTKRLGPKVVWKSLKKLRELQTKRLFSVRERANYVLPVVKKLLEFLENHTEDASHSDDSDEDSSKLVPYKEAIIPHLKSVISACEFLSSS
jgi:hypothetical protein